MLQWGALIGIGVPLLFSGAYAAAATAIPGGTALLQIPSLVEIYRARRGIIAEAQLESGGKVVIRGKHLPRAKLMTARGPDAGWVLRLEHDDGDVDLHGQQALSVASRLLARINQAGAKNAMVQRAVERLEHETSPGALFAAVATQPQQEPSSWIRYSSGVGAGTKYDPPGTLRSLAFADRLALEMATHEERERQALEGELSALEAAWREAEEIASIADSLGLPPWIDDLLNRHRLRKHEPGA